VWILGVCRHSAFQLLYSHRGQVDPQTSSLFLLSEQTHRWGPV
jgi:hypothetical protein